MRNSNVLEHQGQEQIVDPLTDLLRKGAGKLIYHEVDAELQELLSGCSNRQTEGGETAVVHNGYHPERELQKGVEPERCEYLKSAPEQVKPQHFTRHWCRRM